MSSQGLAGIIKKLQCFAGASGLSDHLNLYVVAFDARPRKDTVTTVGQHLLPASFLWKDTGCGLPLLHKDAKAHGSVLAVG